MIDSDNKITIYCDPKRLLDRIGHSERIAGNLLEDMVILRDRGHLGLEQMIHGCAPQILSATRDF